MMLTLITGSAWAGPGTARPFPGFERLDSRLRIEALRAPAATTSWISVFVQSKDPSATRKLVKQLGGRVGVSGRITTAHLPRARLRQLAAHASVEYVEHSRPVRARLDTLLPATKADQVHRGAPPLNTSYSGKGVIVGVIDIGLDLSHSMFRTADGKTRVVALWDQEGSGTPPEGFAYGAVCSNAEIDQGVCAHVPSGDHGTHVTGILAGTRGAIEPYAGVAPEADIVFVNLGQKPGVSEDDMLATGVCEGAQWIFALAARQGKPAVVNMSLGEHSGPHDGTSLGSQCLDQLAGPGRILVAAAGNEGQGALGNPVYSDRTYVHATATATASAQSLQFLMGVSDLGEGQSLYWQDVYLWFEPNVELSVRLGVTDDSQTTAWSQPVTAATAFGPTELKTPANTYRKIEAAGAQLPGAGPKGILLRVEDENNDAAEADWVWSVEVTGNGRFDAFIDTSYYGGFVTTDAPAGSIIDNTMTIGFPAIAKSVLAVGSYVTRNTWQQGGQMYEQKDSITDLLVGLGELSDFSSRGPSRNPMLTGPVPDIVAPGELIASALASQIPQQDATRVLVPAPNGIVLFEGTSMASPALAGVVALMLEKDPSLSVEDVRQILSTTAELPKGVTAPSNDWGYGKVNALSAVAAVGDEDMAPEAGGTGAADNPTQGRAGNGGAGSNPKSGAGGSDDDGCGCRFVGSLGAERFPPGYWLGLAVSLLGLRRRNWDPV